MNAVIYARYSSDNQREESIEGQLRECMEFAKRKGYTVVKTYADRAISGKRADNRPEFQQMISDSATGEFDTIIVWKRKDILQIDDARIIFRNFSGAPSKYNRVDDRNFAVLIPAEEQANELIERGYELDILRELPYSDGTVVAEWREHQPVPDTECWVYLFQYATGCEGWNCIQTDILAEFISLR